MVLLEHLTNQGLSARKYTANAPRPGGDIFPTISSDTLSKLRTLPMDSFDEASQAFIIWLRESGADISSKIELKDLRSIQAGRGVGKLTWKLSLLFATS